MVADPLEGETWSSDTVTWSFATSNLPTKKQIKLSMVYAPVLDTFTQLRLAGYSGEQIARSRR